MVGRIRAMFITAHRDHLILSHRHLDVEREWSDKPQRIPLEWALCHYRVWISSQVHCVTPRLKTEMRRRAAVERVSGHLKAEHRIGRNHLKVYNGDRINTVLAAAGYNFSLLRRWLERLLCDVFRILAFMSADKSTTPKVPKIA